MFIHIGIHFLTIHTVLAYPERYLQTTTSVNYFTDCLQFFRAFFAAIVPILENILKNQIEHELNASIEAIDTEIFARHLCSNTKSCSFCQKRSLKFCFYSRIVYLPVIGILIDFTIMKMVFETHKLWSEDLYIREFSASMVRIGVIQIVCYFYWVCASVIKFLSLFSKKTFQCWLFEFICLKLKNRLQYVQKELDRLIRSTSNHSVPDHVTSALIVLKSFYSRLWKINLLMNKRFNWTVFALVANFFCATVVGSYWTAQHICRNEMKLSMRKATIIYSKMTTYFIKIWKIIRISSNSAAKHNVMHSNYIDNYRSRWLDPMHQTNCQIDIS